MTTTADPRVVIYRQLMHWPLPPMQVADDIIAALDAAGYEVVAAAELRRLRHRDADLGALLDAVKDPGELRRSAWFFTVHGERERADYLDRIAAAVEGIDQEHER